LANRIRQNGVHLPFFPKPNLHLPLIGDVLEKMEGGSTTGPIDYRRMVLQLEIPAVFMAHSQLGEYRRFFAPFPAIPSVEHRLGFIGMDQLPAIDFSYLRRRIPQHFGETVVDIGYPPLLNDDDTFGDVVRQETESGGLVRR
jgi:hypothetical protein